MLNSIKKDMKSYRHYITNKNSGIKKKLILRLLVIFSSNYLQL